MNRLVELCDAPLDSPPQVITLILNSIEHEFLPLLYSRPSTIISEAFLRSTPHESCLAKKFISRLAFEFCKTIDFESVTLDKIMENLCKYMDFKFIMKSEKRIQNTILLRLLTFSSPPLLPPPPPSLCELVAWCSLTEESLIDNIFHQLEKGEGALMIMTEALANRKLVARINSTPSIINAVVKKVSLDAEPERLLRCYLILLQTCKSSPLFSDEDIDALIRIGLTTLSSSSSSSSDVDHHQVSKWIIVKDFLSITINHSQTRKRIFHWLKAGLLRKLFGLLDCPDITRTCVILSLLIPIILSARENNVDIGKVDGESIGFLLRCLNGFGMESFLSMKIIIGLQGSSMLNQQDELVLDSEILSLSRDEKRVFSYDGQYDNGEQLCNLLLEYFKIRGLAGNHPKLYETFQTFLKTWSSPPKVVLVAVPSSPPPTSITKDSEQSLLSMVINSRLKLKEIHKETQLKFHETVKPLQEEMNQLNLQVSKSNETLQKTLENLDLVTCLVKTLEGEKAKLQSTLNAQQVEFTQSKQQLLELQSSYNLLMEEKDQIRTELIRSESTIVEQRQQQRVLEANLVEERGKCTSLANRNEELILETGNVQNALDSQMERMSNLQQAYYDLNERLCEKDQKIREISGNLESLETSRLELNDRVNQLLKEAKVRSAVDRVERSRLQVKYEGEIFHLNTQLNNLRVELESKNAREKALQNELTIIREALQQKDLANNQLDTELQRLLSEAQFDPLLNHREEETGKCL